MRRLIVLLAVPLIVACATTHRIPLRWQNADHPTADSTRDLYDCDITARQTLALEYPNNALAQQVNHDKEVLACMHARGWRHVHRCYEAGCT